MMIKRTLRFCFAILGISFMHLLMSPTVSAASELVGVIRDSITAAPLSGVVVKILQTGDSTQTDVSGRYVFGNLATGSYTLLIGRSTYVPLIRTQVTIGSCCIGTTGNTDCDPLNSVDIGDLTTLVDHLFISFAPLCCAGEGNCDGDSLGSVDIGDLTTLVDYLFITFTPTANCQ